MYNTPSIVKEAGIKQVLLGKGLKSIKGSTKNMKSIGDLFNVSSKGLKFNIPLKKLKFSLGRNKQFILDTKKLAPMMKGLSTGGQGLGELTSLLAGSKKYRRNLLNVLKDKQVRKSLKGLWDPSHPTKSLFGMMKNKIMGKPIYDVGTIGKAIAGKPGSKAVKRMAAGFGDALEQFGKNDLSSIITRI